MDRDDVFEVIEEPALRIAFLDNLSVLSVATIEPDDAAEAPADAAEKTDGVTSVIERWRKSAFLPNSYRVTRRAWTVSAAFRPGVALSDDGGLTASRGEEAIRGFFNGDEHCHDVVEALLRKSVGLTLRVPGDMTALLVAEAHFESCVEIGESYLISELPVLV